MLWNCLSLTLGLEQCANLMIQSEVLRNLYQRTLHVLRLLQHRQASHRTFPAFLRGIDRPRIHGMVCEPLLGDVRTAFQ